jgi:hypothetical protein
MHKFQRENEIEHRRVVSTARIPGNSQTRAQIG